MASSTVTDAIVTSSRWGFLTWMRISPGRSSTRRTSSSSAGGGLPPTRSTTRSPWETTTATASASRTSGHERPQAPPELARGRADLHYVLHLEVAHPAELGELRLVGVEHERARVGEADLEDTALALALHDGVGVLPVVAGARRLVAEEVGVQVERVDQVELGEVGEVGADELAAPHPDRVARVVERPPVDRVEVVLAVAVRVEAVHHEHELARGLARHLRVDDERAVEALVDVLLERRRMAVVDVEARRPGRELVRQLVPRRDDLEDAVHVRGVDPVEVDRVRVRARVHEAHPQEVVLGGADHGAGNGAVVRPRGEEHSRRDLDLLVRRDERVVAHPARLVGQRARRVEQRVEVVRAADRGRALADHRRVPRGGRRRHARQPCDGPCGRGPPLRASPPRREREPERRGRQGRRRAQEPPPREFRHA